jgi:hypothetical protein
MIASVSSGADSVARFLLSFPANFWSVVLEILVITVGGAGAALLFVSVRHLVEKLLRVGTRKPEPPPARMTDPLAWGGRPRAQPNDPVIEFTSDVRRASPRAPWSPVSRPGVEGELWVQEYVGRLRKLLPGISIESPPPEPKADDDAVELDSSVLSCVLDDEEGQDGVLCASSVVADVRAGPATRAEIAVRATFSAHAKTLILGGMQDLAGLDEPVDARASSRGARW